VNIVDIDRELEQNAEDINFTLGGALAPAPRFQAAI
jgi:hypothetical protein